MKLSYKKVYDGFKRESSESLIHFVNCNAGNAAKRMEMQNECAGNMSQGRRRPWIIADNKKCREIPE